MFAVLKNGPCDLDRIVEGKFSDDALWSAVGVCQPCCELSASHNFDLFSQSPDDLAEDPDLAVRVPARDQDISCVPQGAQAAFLRALGYGVVQLLKERFRVRHKGYLKLSQEIVPTPELCFAGRTVPISVEEIKDDIDVGTHGQGPAEIRADDAQAGFHRRDIVE